MIYIKIKLNSIEFHQLLKQTDGASIVNSFGRTMFRFNNKPFQVRFPFNKPIVVCFAEKNRKEAMLFRLKVKV